MSIRTSILIPLLFALVTAAGCASSGGSRDPDRMSAPELYEAAQVRTSVADYPGAVQYLERLESRFPFSQEAQHAQLELIYAHYKAGNHEQAQAASDRFLREQPRHPDIDYVHYLRGLINFDRGLNILDAAFGVDPAKREPMLARRSFQSFATLVSSYPESRYVPDAQQRMIHLRNQLARHEVYVARYYLRIGAWVAAVNRARVVVEQYEETPSAVDGLVILHRAYRRLEMDDLADDIERVIVANYPEARTRLTP